MFIANKVLANYYSVSLKNLKIFVCACIIPALVGCRSWEATLSSTDTLVRQSNRSSRFITPPVQFDGNFEMVSVYEGEEEKNKALAIAALCYINHLNYVVAHLGEMKDIIVLEQEYENLTDNNLNLACIEDIETVEIIQAIMDLITEMEKNNINSIVAQLALAKAKKDALWKALPSPGVLIPGGGTPLQMAIQVSLAVTTSVLTSYQNYMNAKAEAEKEYNSKNLELSLEKLEQLNELNKELCYSQWRLMKKYGLTDYNRVTRNESQLLQNLSQLSNLYERINSSKTIYWEILKNNQFTYSNLQQYWVARASAATTLYGRKEFSKVEKKKFREDIIYSCENYFNLLKNAPIIRKDPIANSLALLYVTLKLEKMEEMNYVVTGDEQNVLLQWLRYIEANTRMVDAKTKYALVELYKHKVIGNNEEALRLALSAFIEVHACLDLYNKENKNLFCMTSSFKTAMEDWVITNVGEKCKKGNECKGNAPDKPSYCEKCLPEAQLKNIDKKWKTEQRRLLPIDEWYCLFDSVMSCLKDNGKALEEFIKNYTFPLEENDIVSSMQRYMGVKSEKVRVQHCLEKIKIKPNSEETQAWIIKFPKEWVHYHAVKTNGNVINGEVDLGAISIRNSSGRLQNVESQLDDSGNIIVLTLKGLASDSDERYSLFVKVTNVCQIELIFGFEAAKLKLKKCLVRTNSGFVKEFDISVGRVGEVLISE